MGLQNILMGSICIESDSHLAVNNRAEKEEEEV